MRVMIALVIIALMAPQYASSPSSEVMVVDVIDGDLIALDGSGVIIAVADTGIDMDHSCFRNSTEEVGVPGPSHRKIILLNDTVDDWDNQGHQQFRHGTHIAGILACDAVDGAEGVRSLSNGSKLLVQDVVDSTGWVVPENVDSLLSEASANGAVINSWSWGDNSINYTNRSHTIDEWTVENPWSLIFVAPGNNGGMMLEPSNAYNVVSVAASDSEENGGMWPSSSHGPDVNGRRGTLISAPGMGVVSAKADGDKSSLNNGTYAMTGTSMATPMAASFTALLQQKVEQEYGYTPSAPLLRAMLASSAEGIIGDSPDPIQGYGRPNLDSFSGGLFIHDSYQVEDWVSIIQSRGSSLESLKSNPWDGSEAAGPFLSQNESWSEFFRPTPGEDVEIVMSYNARPMGQEIDDLRLILKTSDGRFAVDDKIGNSGYSQLYYSSFTTPVALNSSNETTVMIRVAAEMLEDVEWIEVEVLANSISGTGQNGTLGIDGTMLGFGIAATGVSDLIQNTGPTIVMNDGPSGGENYSTNFTINLTIGDLELDGVLVETNLVNSNFSISFDGCTFALVNQSDFLCTIDVSRDLVPLPINREDWYFEIIAFDDNSSFWTESKNSSFETEIFTIWWEPPLLEEPDVSPPMEESDGVRDNRTFIWGVLGIVTGVVVATSVMFRSRESVISEWVLPPFREEE